MKKEMKNTWICRAWTKNAWDGWTSDFYRFATKEEAEEFGKIHLALIGYDDDDRKYEVYNEIDRDQETEPDGRKWYAVQEDSTDAWDNGSYEYGTAVEMLRRQGCGLIAIIEKDDAGAPICTGEIMFDEIC